MNTKTAKYLACGLAAMGLVHILATFTPIIAGKLEPLAAPAQKAFTYMSLMCGILLLLGGILIYQFVGKLKEFPFLLTPYRMIQYTLLLDGMFAVVFMPLNPCSWIIFVLAILLAFTKREKS